MSGALAPLIKDVACRANMMWATRLESELPVDGFLDSLKKQGFSSGRGAIPGLSVLDHDDTGHRVIYVPRTGRIQIRLDALTRHEERIEAAQRIYEIVRLAAEQASGEAGRGDEPEHGAD